MEKTIKLLENHARLDDYEPFLMPDKLIVNFEHKGYDLSNAFITLRNGEKIEKFKFLNHFEIPKNFLYAGDLYVKVEMYLGGEKAKQWISLPIRIKETKTGLVINDLLYELEKKISNSVDIKTFNDLVSVVNKLIENHNKLAETVSELKEI